VNWEERTTEQRSGSIRFQSWERFITAFEDWLEAASDSRSYGPLGASSRQIRLAIDELIASYMSVRPFLGAYYRTTSLDPVIELLSQEPSSMEETLFRCRINEVEAAMDKYDAHLRCLDANS